MSRIMGRGYSLTNAGVGMETMREGNRLQKPNWHKKVMLGCPARYLQGLTVNRDNGRRS